MGCIFHKWDGCVCTACGKTRHKWRPYDDVLTWGSHNDRICKRCGELQLDYVPKEPESITHGPCDDCPYFDNCDDDPSSCHYNRD